MFDIPTTLAKNLKYLREKAHLTQDELSDKAGVAYSTIAKLEQGAIKNPTLTTVWSITQVLGVDLQLHAQDRRSRSRTQGARIH